MASLRKLKGKYYARIRFSTNGKRKEKLFFLDTPYQREAEKRRLEVNQNLSLVMDDSFIPSWKSENGLPDEKKYCLSEAKSDFLKSKESDKLRAGTLEVYGLGIDRFIKAVSDKPVNEITIKEIDLFKAFYMDKLKPATINIDLRTMKVLLNWLKDRDRIKATPKIKQIQYGKSKPVYVTNDEFEKICKRVDPHYARAFYFYRETGLRLSEPFNGEIDGNFLTIPADKYKGKRDHEIHLTPELMTILKEMRLMVDEKVNRKMTTRKTAIKYYSKVFRKACKGDMRKKIKPILNRKFHSLRHTTAVRLYLTTRDIYRVMKQLGHSTVTTTEIYSKFSDRRLAQDFPDLVKQTTKTPEKTAKKHEGDTELGVPLQPVFA